MNASDKKSQGEELVARLLTPQETDAVAGGRVRNLCAEYRWVLQIRPEKRRI